jgi:hypothetical protein
MEAVLISETSAYFYDPALRLIPKGCAFHTRHHENSNYLPMSWKNGVRYLEGIGQFFLRYWVQKK